MPKVKPTKPFTRNLKRLSRHDADVVISALTLFMREPKAHILNFEPVTSRKGYFTIRGTYAVRILLEGIGPDEFAVVAVGNHDYIYHSYFKK